MSVAPKQTIFVEPTALYFPPPLTRHIVNIVTVINSTDQPCVFKVHSFEPELYTVKPSAAVLAANSACRVQISLRKMKTEPDAAGITELNRKQKFKVRAKNVPAATYSKINSGPTPLSGGDVWKLCDQLPYSMDATLTCNFSGEVSPGATVTFDAPATGSHAAGGEMPSPPPTARSSTAANMRSPTPPPAATATASNGNRAVSFVPPTAESAAASTSAPPPMKSSLKQQAAAEVVSASSATIRANTNTKSAISNSIADHNLRKTQLEQEIKEKQALLASLAAAEAQESNKKKSSSGSGKHKKKKFLMKKVSISVVLILVIIFYVIGSVVRAKVGGEHVNRYVESIVPEEVRTAMASSKAAIDGAVANSLSSFSATGIGAENSGATTKEGATATPTLEEEAAAEAKLDKSTSEEGAAKSAKKEETSTESSLKSKEESSPASASGGEKKKRRRKKKVVKTEA